MNKQRKYYMMRWLTPWSNYDIYLYIIGSVNSL